MKSEFTGSYYQCDSCEHIWDFNDSNCPFCGEDMLITELNGKELRGKQQALENETNRLEKMLQSHGD